MKIPVPTLDALRLFAQSVASSLRERGGVTIGLTGELGAGKTTFVRFLAESLGSADAVSSPTYVLAHEYDIPGGRMEHWDLYRLTSIPDDLLAPPGSHTIRLVEWADRDASFLSGCDMLIHFLGPASRQREAHLTVGGELLGLLEEVARSGFKNGGTRS